MSPIPEPPNKTLLTSDTPLLAATSLALVTLIPIAAHQLGGLNHLPDPSGGIFSSDEITESSVAHPLGIPDGLLGIANYGVTLSLILLARNRPKARKFLALKLAADGSVADLNMVRQVISFRKLCSWCTATALCTAAMVYSGRILIAEQIAEFRDRS